MRILFLLIWTEERRLLDVLFIGVYTRLAQHRQMSVAMMARDFYLAGHVGLDPRLVEARWLEARPDYTYPPNVSLIRKEDQ